MHWYNLPSIVCMYTIIWDVKGYMVPIKCDVRSYVIFLLILPLHRLKYKHITDHKNDLLLFFACTYCDVHLQVFGNHIVAVVVMVLQALICEVDLSTVLTGMFTRCHSYCYSICIKVSSRKRSIVAATGEGPSINDLKLVWKGFLGAISANKA